MSLNEVAYKRGHHYTTVLTNYEDARVIWMEKDRRGQDLKKLYGGLGDGLKSIETISMDF